MHPSRLFKQHPVGLYVLCAVEAAAGFALYVLGSLLLLYLIDTAKYDQETALRWVGGYNAACFIAPLLGGVLADAGLRFRRTVLLGAVLLMAGFLALSQLDRQPKIALTLLWLGNGLFRSNLVAMLGRLYPANDARQDAAYRLLYAAFNVGGLIAPAIAGGLARAGRWDAAFLLAAMAMGVAVLLLFWAHPHLARADQNLDDHLPTPESPRRATRPFARWLAVWVLAQVTMLWALAYGQADGMMLLWARDYTQRVVLGVELAPSAFAAIPPAFVLLFTLLAALFRSPGRSVPRRVKIQTGLFATSAGFGLMVLSVPQSGHLASAAWSLACLALLTVGELLVVPVTQSLINRLAPHGRIGLGCAVWYAAAALGLWLAGQLAALSGNIPPAAFFAILALAPLTAAVLLACQRSGVRISGPCPPAALHTKPIFEAIRCAATERGPTSLCRLTEQRSKHERSGGPR